LQKISTRLAKPVVEDAAAFCGVMNSLYARKVNEDYYYWQFFDTPHHCGLVFIEVEGEVVGNLGLHLIPLRTGELIAWCIDIAISKSHQGIGLFQHLYHAVEEFALSNQAGALAVMGNPNAHQVLTQKFGWVGVREIDTFALRGFPSTGAPLATLTAPSSDPAWYSNPNSNFADRSAKWLTRRFSRNPRYQYAFYEFKVGSESEILAVSKEFTDPVTAATYIDIVEFLSTTNEKKAVLNALEQILNNAPSGAQFVTWLETRSTFDEVARDLGFKPMNKPRFFDMKLLDDEKSHLLESDRWHLTMQDAEVY
jgi:GNAT superfamily N-acetyltransferase